MSSLNILIVEGNNRQDSAFFVEAAGATAADNLKNLVLKLEPSAEVTMINPTEDNETKMALENMSDYHGIIFTGGAMRINDMTDEIKKHINFATNCFKHQNIWFEKFIALHNNILQYQCISYNNVLLFLSS